MISSTTTVKKPYLSFLAFTVLLLLVASVTALVQARTPTAPATAGGPTPFFSLSGTLSPGQSISPSYSASQNRPFNFSLAAANSGPIDLTITDSNGMPTWTGAAMTGETVWGYGQLTPGSNNIALTNTGASTATFAIRLYNTPSAPYSWAGVADASGVNSSIKLTFAQSGLYTFNTDVTGGRFQFLVNGGQHIQKTVSNSTEGAYEYFIPAGTHTLVVDQDPSIGAGWSVNVSAVGDAANSLPVTEMGGQLGGSSNFDAEWFPVYLSAARPSNIKMVATGTDADNLHLMIKQGPNTLLHLPAIYTGETTWANVSLPNGLVMVGVMANGGNVDPISYTLTLDNLNNANSTWSGTAHPAGANSTIHMNFQASGLYNFDLSALSGGYQLKLNDEYLLRTAWLNNTSTHYVPQGVHKVTIIQDDLVGADWSANISLSSTNMNTLPFNISGNTLSGPDNDFNTEWFPIRLAENSDVNMKLTVNSADPNAMIDVAIYNPGSITPNHLIEDITAQEAHWATFNLMAGANRVRVTANGAELTGYDISLIAIPTDSSSWSGTALGNRTNAYAFETSTSGLYRFHIDADPGFANLNVDSLNFADGSTVRMSPTSLGYSFDRELSAGMHLIETLPDGNYVTTTWSAQVMPISPAESFFSFNGDVMDGDTVAAQYELPAGPLDINFSVEVMGSGPVDLTIQDSTGTPVWSGPVHDGEKLWGNTTLAGGLNHFIFSNGTLSTTNVVLNAYPVPNTDFAWDGMANAGGNNSKMLVNFEESGLYAFNFTTGGGRYQFAINDDYVLKTVEGVDSDTFFIPAGTHELTIDQDTTVGANDWSVVIIPTGITEDSLPFNASGGALGGGGNDFNQEWIPVHLSAATDVNISLSAMGLMTDSLLLHVFSPSSGVPILTIPAVYGSETIWDSFQLPVGTNYIHVVANGANTDSLDYQLQIRELATAPDSWAGTTTAPGVTSEIRMEFPTSGLYTFDFGVNAGIYEFQINNNFIQKIVYTDTVSTMYIPAGVHTLGIIQHVAIGADWNVTVLNAGTTNDALPYHQTGFGLGGDFNNNFTDEWITFNLGEQTQANIRLEATGAASNDRLTFHIFDLNTGGLLYTINPVSVGEVVWNSFDLPATGARLQISADGGNVAGVGYDLQFVEIPTIINNTDPSIVWAGTSYGDGLNSGIRVNTHLSGTYHIEVYMETGFTSLLIDAALPFQQFGGGGFYYDYETTLSAGQHTFVSDQDTAYPVTDWVITATLMEAAPPNIVSITPDAGPNDEDTMATIVGGNFMPGSTVALNNPVDNINLGNVTYMSSNELMVVVPAGSEPGVYDVVITNPDGQSTTLVAGYEIFDVTPVFNSYIVIVFGGTTD
ncbi:MAG TPA: IPT/TIG domain-containing protein [Anaerolineae bacterium]|nr:IPT/TIG domain-containing protein [Anaerolineae bacterium]